MRAPFWPLAAAPAAGFDALLCPAVAFPAVTHGGFLALGGIESSYETLFNLTGLPAGGPPFGIGRGIR